MMLLKVCIELMALNPFSDYLPQSVNERISAEHIVNVMPEKDVSVREIYYSYGTSCEYEENLATDIFFPELPWRVLDKTQYERLRNTNKEFDSRNTVGICQLPLELLGEVRESLLEALPLPIEALENLVMKRFSRSTGQPDDTRYMGNSVYEVGLRTGSADYSRYPIKSFVGLHIDCWNKLRPEVSNQGRNRICINLGIEERYLLFVNLTLPGIIQALEADISNYTKPTEIGQDFMRNFPDYPVIKLPLLPGQAYIALTDTIIHDVTTINKTQEDRILAWLGHFSI